MTKKERVAIQNYINDIVKYMEEEERTFKKLQDLNWKEGTGHKWCCAWENFKDLLKSGKNYEWIYTRYIEARAAQDTISKLGSVLADMGFWKN